MFASCWRTMALLVVTALEWMIPLVTAEATYTVMAVSTSGFATNDLIAKITATGASVVSVNTAIGLASIASDNPTICTQVKAVSGIASCIPTAIWTSGEGEQFVEAPLDAPPVRRNLRGASAAAAADARAGDVPTARDLVPLITVESDNLQNNMWNLHAMDVKRAWAAGYTGGQRKGAALRRATRIAILDLGFHTKHEALKGKVVATTSCVDNGAEPFDPPYAQYHGTAVAGVAAGKGPDFAGPPALTGYRGVAHGAELMLVKVMSDKTGWGEDLWIINGITWAAEHGADVINLSISGGPYLKNSKTPYPDTRMRDLFNIYKRAVDYAESKGVVVVASAGNSAFNFDGARSAYFVPMSIPKVVTVAASGPINWAADPTPENEGRAATYTSYGVKTVDCNAAGGNINVGTRPDLPLTDHITECTVTCFGYNNNRVRANLPTMCYFLDYIWCPYRWDDVGYSRYTWGYGTGLASPAAAGVAALIIAASPKRLTPAQVRSTLLSLVDDLGKPGGDPFFGAGRLNAGKIVDLYGAPQG